MAEHIREEGVGGRLRERQVESKGREMGDNGEEDHYGKGCKEKRKGGEMGTDS